MGPLAESPSSLTLPVLIWKKGLLSPTRWGHPKGVPYEIHSYFIEHSTIWEHIPPMLTSKTSMLLFQPNMWMGAVCSPSIISVDKTERNRVCFPPPWEERKPCCTCFQIPNIKSRQLALVHKAMSQVCQSVCVISFHVCYIKYN